MVRITSFRFCLVLWLLTAIALVHPPSADATRVDVDDPLVLGSLVRRDFIYHANEFERAITDVRYQDGIYSYIYAISSSPYFPATSCCEAGMVSFAVTGHALETTWGAVNSSDIWWTADPEHPGHTKTVAGIIPVFDGFLVVPQGPGRFAVVYMQSPLPPSRHAILTYTGRVHDSDHNPEGILRVESFQTDGVLAPAPEPASIVLFGLGLAGLAAKRRMERRRRND